MMVCDGFIQSKELAKNCFLVLSRKQHLNKSKHFMVIGLEIKTFIIVIRLGDNGGFLLSDILMK